MVHKAFDRTTTRGRVEYVTCGAGVVRRAPSRPHRIRSTDPGHRIGFTRFTRHPTVVEYLHTHACHSTSTSAADGGPPPPRGAGAGAALGAAAPSWPPSDELLELPAATGATDDDDDGAASASASAAPPAAPSPSCAPASMDDGLRDSDGCAGGEPGGGGRPNERRSRSCSSRFSTRPVTSSPRAAANRLSSPTLIRSSVSSVMGGPLSTVREAAREAGGAGCRARIAWSSRAWNRDSFECSTTRPGKAPPLLPPPLPPPCERPPRYDLCPRRRPLATAAESPPPPPSPPSSSSSSKRL